MIESIKQQLDNRGVSPVIGVILMVAITVILAAVIGSFVLGIGGDVEKTPQASLTVDVDATNDEFTLTHNGGDSIDTGNLKVTVAGSEVTGGDWSPTTLTAGTSSTYGTISIGEGDTIRVIHTPTDSTLITAEA